MQNSEPFLVKDFIESFRHRIGDSSKSVPASYIISYLNTALRRLPRQDGLERLFERRDTWALAALNKDGTPAAAWNLGAMGTVLDIRKSRLLKTTSGKVCEIKPVFKEYDVFFDLTPLPEQNTPGDPQYFTIEQIGGINRLLVNRPPGDLITLDMLYSCFHPRITSQESEILLSWDFADLLEEYVMILHKIETTDQATARSLWEDLDVLTADIRELLARRKTTLGYARIARSF